MALQTEMQGDFQERRREWQERGHCRQCGGDIITIAGTRRCDECGLAVEQELARDLVEPKLQARRLPWEELAKGRGAQAPGIHEPVIIGPTTVDPAALPVAAARQAEEATAEPDTMPRPIPWAVRAEQDRQPKAAAAATEQPAGEQAKPERTIVPPSPLQDVAVENYLQDTPVPGLSKFTGKRRKE